MRHSEYDSVRRIEFASNDNEEFQEISQKVMVGNLGLVDENSFPRIVPINFVTIDRTVYFHGARAGEKYNLLQNNPKTTFSIDFPLAYIPSYFITDNYACQASHFFKSIHIRGIGSEVIDLHEKAKALNALMQKYQPERNYEEITLEKKMYKQGLVEVGVFKVEPIEVTVKIKVGQNIKLDILQKIMKGLQEHSSEINNITLKEIKKYQTQEMHDNSQ